MTEQEKLMIENLKTMNVAKYKASKNFVDVSAMIGEKELNECHTMYYFWHIDEVSWSTMEELNKELFDLIVQYGKVLVAAGLLHAECLPE